MVIIYLNLESRMCMNTNMKKSNKMAALALVAKLATRWRHLH